MTAQARARAIGGPLLDRPMLWLLALFAVAEAVIVFRFIDGIGAVSNMNDGYAWGIWEPVNVVVFTGIGAGAYSVGLLCYLLNRGHYHPLVRPAVLLAAIAYSLGGASIVVALGRPWNMYLLAAPPLWNLSSVLLEVAVCVIAYVCVLWIEMLPAVLDDAARSPERARAAWGQRWGRRLARAMPWIIALAMLLPTMHQSSLGGLMIVAGPKLHPLWHTSLLPLLALVSCLSMGLGAVVVLTALMKHTWSARLDGLLLADMSRVNGLLLVLFAVVRLADIAWSGKLGLLLVPDFHLAFFVLELALFLIPAFLFLSRRVRQNRARIAGALAVVAGCSLWRIDAFLTCYDAGEGWSYWPSAGELAVTVGMAALGVAVFILVSRLLPVVELQEPVVSTSVPAAVAAFVLSGPAEAAQGQEAPRVTAGPGAAATRPAEGAGAPG
ncbi:MAG: Ni/Fe-hydrogenase cytochrome b subunit [Deltaproteobacteria bacterium]|nr:Ni/Fe-hydrogenase cytochrome b subunit [Deltaproteobacteria bacterium]